MCGIFGWYNPALKVSKTLEMTEFHHFFDEMSLRGKDASGISLFSPNEFVLLKRPHEGSLFVRSLDFQKTTESLINEKLLGYLGHCRLMTDGSAVEERFNQPISNNSILGLHNGIIVNNFEGESDSIFFFQKIEEELSKSHDYCKSMANVLKEINGSVSTAFLHKETMNLILYSNTGSLFYTIRDKDLYFASEKIALEKMFPESTHQIIQMREHDILIYQYENQKIHLHSLNDESSFKLDGKLLSEKTIFKTVENLKRCKKCILPETYPFISFDESGVCNYCHHYEKQKLFGEEKLLRRLEKYRSKDGSPDCLIGLSGGRDSCYGLHLLKTKYGMNPIAYTFDWGLTTDISRKNQALMCGKLNVEHIIRSPDIIKKRRFVRKNVNAWLKKPHLGMIPLFQAGDKEFYHYGRQLRKELNIDLTVLCSGYQLEQREFMIGFAGVDQPPLRNNHDFYYHPIQTKIKLALSYCFEYLKNPAYINESLYDSVKAYCISFFAKADFLYLFHYVPWNESEIEKVLIDDYNWKVDYGYGKNQWRMGDGQTAFNNYIYYKVAGFSEYDVFRSNQIREGLMTRDEALELVQQDNIPKKQSIKEFFELIGLPFEEVMRKIELIPKIF